MGRNQGVYEEMLKDLFSLPVEIIKNRKLIFNLAKNDFKTKYAGSYLGVAWAFVQPVITVLIYWFVFDKALHAAEINTKAGIEVPYVLWLVAGLMPWFFFSDGLNFGTSSLLDYSYLVKKVVFKISILPIVKIISALFVHIFFVAFTFFLYFAYGYKPEIYWIQSIYYSFCIFVLVIGLSYITSAFVVFFKDLTPIINIVLQVGVWMTPIMWNIDTMELNPIILSILRLNPMFYVVNGYRNTLINKVWFWETPGQTLYFWAFTLIILIIGITVFNKLKIHFSDVL